MVKGAVLFIFPLLTLLSIGGVLKELLHTSSTNTYMGVFSSHLNLVSNNTQISPSAFWKVDKETVYQQSHIMTFAAHTLKPVL